MKDSSKPTVEVKLSDGGETASVVVEFPFAEQAFAFGEVVNVLLQKMPQVAKVPET